MRKCADSAGIAAGWRSLAHAPWRGAWRKARAPEMPRRCANTVRFAGHGAACLAGLLAWASASADERALATETLKLDSTQSSAAFSVKVMWMFAVDGHFGNVRGTVQIDRFRSQATVDAFIDTAAVTMRRNSALAWVKSTEFFDVEHYPEIRFRSEAFPLTRLRLGGQIPGALTMRGITRPVAFAVMPSRCDKPAIACPIEAAGSVSRSEFGMSTRRATLADKVELSFNIRIVKAVPGAAES